MAISVGIVGCGAFGRHFVKPYLDHPDVSRVALCDIDPDKLATRAGEFGITETYDSLDALCASDLDAVVIITQHWLHAPQAMQAMDAGKHVYTAVPAARSLEECNDLVETAKRTGQLYMNGETSFFRPELQYCRARAQAGDFGEIVHIEAEYLHDLDHGLRDVYRWRYGKRFGPNVTGEAPMWYPSHSVSFAVAVARAPMTSVSCLGFRLPGDDWYREDTDHQNPYSNETALFEMASGATARICEYRRVGHRGAERVTRVYGTEASFEAGNAGTSWCTKDGHEAIEVPPDFEPLPDKLQADKGGHGGSHAYLVNEFVSAVRDQRQPRINVWEAVRYVAPGLVAHESAMRGGERLPVPDWGDAPA